MALKPRNLDWLNISDRFRPYFQWNNGDKVLSLCNFTILIGCAGFGAQVLFGIPTLSGARDLSTTLAEYDRTLLLLALIAGAVLVFVRYRLYFGASALFAGMAWYLLEKFSEIILSEGGPVFETMIDVVLLPITATLGLLISVTYAWAAYVLWNAKKDINA